MNDRILVMLEKCGPEARTIAVEQALSTDGFVYAAIAGKQGAGFAVRLYGEAPACVPRPAAPLPTQGQRVTLTLVVQGQEVPLPGSGGGCSSTASGTALAALVLVALALSRDRRVRVPARRSRR